MKTVTKLSIWLGVVAVACFGFTLEASARSADGINAAGAVSSQFAGDNFLSWRTVATGQVVGFFTSPLREDRDHKKKKETVPEGGSPLLYLALAGLSCFGAMIIRSRIKAKKAT